MPHFLNNHYDIYAKRPKLGKLKPKLEKLAKQVISKGLLRISTTAEYNFVLFPVRNGEKYLSFSKREVYDKELLKQTKAIIKKNLLPSEKKDAASEVRYKIQLIREEVDKYLPISEEHELQIARIVVQSAEPVIIQNLINDNIYFFISFKHTISDLLSVKNWESARFSQGLQSNSVQEAAIFASCGGNPFFDPKDSNNEYDGIKAADRLSVILAQEIGHYADIIKDAKQRNVDRFSSTIDMTKPKKVVENAIKKDLNRTKKIHKNLLKLGAKKVFDLERQVSIQGKYRKKSLSYFFSLIKLTFSQMAYVSRCNDAGLKFIKLLYKKHGDIGKLSMLLSGDMEFNLNPSSLAYRNSDKNIERAVNCAEALARIPQQKVKWGQEIVEYFSPNLSKVYFNYVIKEELNYYKLMNGKKFSG